MGEIRQMSVDTLVNEVNRALGDKSANFTNPLANALSTYQQATTQLSTSSGERRAKELFESTDNEQVAEIRRRIQEFKTKLDEAYALRAQAIDQIKSQLTDTLTDDQKKALRKSRNAAKKDIEAILDGLRTLATKFLMDEELAKVVNEFDEGFGKRKGGGGSGAGAPKARVANVKAVHPSGQIVEGKNFTAVAQRTKVSAALLLQGWYEAAGTTDWKSITSEYTYNVGDYAVTVTPRPAKTEEAPVEDQPTAVAI